MSDNYFSSIGLQASGSGPSLAVRSCPGGPAGASVIIGADVHVTDNIIGFNLVSVAFQALPGTLTTAVSATIAIDWLTLSNSTTSTANIQIVAGDGSILLSSAFEMSPSSFISIPMGGIVLTSGFQWTGSAGTYGGVRGYTAF